MSEERERRVGQNEALYRQVNERIEDLNEAFGAVTGDFAIVCECGNLNCMEQVTVPRELYERTRAEATRFIVKAGHEEQDIEDIVEREGAWSIVEKGHPAARHVAEESDPRG